MKEIKIALIGQPNVGKSSLLNALVGPKVIVSNYPGTTVEVTEAEKIFDDTKINFVDTPGIYSIADRSQEEKVTEKVLFEQKIDGAVVIADVTSLSRSLYVLLQISEAQIPIVLALNFVEEADKKGIKIDEGKLKKILGIPVVSINPLTKKGITELLNEILTLKVSDRPKFMTNYDDSIERAINIISTEVKSELPKRFVAIRVLEGDIDFYKYLENENKLKEAKEALRYHPEVAKDISITRYSTASFIASEVTQMVPLKEKKSLVGEMDDILLHKVWGPLATILCFFVIFGILLYLGSWMQDLLMGWAENFLSSFTLADSLLSVILIQGLTGLVAGVSVALPYVFLFYFLLGLLEDIGLLSRFIVNANRFLKKLGLSGKSFIPLALGLGCTVPAIRATRVLSSKKERHYSSALFAFVPCSSRTAIIMGIVGFYGGIKLAFFVFATLFVAGLIWILVVRQIFHIEEEPLLLELPPYRKPLVKDVLIKSWLRMKTFVYIVIPLLAIGGMVYGILELTGLTKVIVEPLSPIADWLGLPVAVIIPLVFGFLQKDLAGAMLISVLGSDISSILSPIQIYTFGIAATIGIPCIIALGMLIKEFGFRKAMILTLVSISYGLLLAGLIWRIISIF
jgi:ferrous iron transport protein B